MQTISSLKKLRKKLPRNYAVLISEKLEGVKPRQVHSVFYGTTKNNEFVLKIVEAAGLVIQDLQSADEKVRKIIKSN